MTPSGFTVLADSAFPRGGGFLTGNVDRARKANEHGSASSLSRSTWFYDVEKLIEGAMPSEKQSAQLVVRAIKGPYRRLTTLTVNSQTRLHFIALCAHLYYYRVRKVD